MGVNYCAIPVSQVRDAESLRWLADCGIVLPPDAADSRNPTLNEMRKVLDSLEGYRVHYSIGKDVWYAEVVDAERGYEGMHAEICLRDFQAEAGEEERPHHFSFFKGAPELNLLILEKFSRLCGPFLFLEDTNGYPVLVTPGADPKRLLERLWAGE